MWQFCCTWEMWAAAILKAAPRQGPVSLCSGQEGSLPPYLLWAPAQPPTTLHPPWMRGTWQMQTFTREPLKALYLSCRTSLAPEGCPSLGNHLPSGYFSFPIKNLLTVLKVFISLCKFCFCSRFSPKPYLLNDLLPPCMNMCWLLTLRIVLENYFCHLEDPRDIVDSRINPGSWERKPGSCPRFSLHCLHARGQLTQALRNSRQSGYSSSCLAHSLVIWKKWKEVSL